MRTRRGVAASSLVLALLAAGTAVDRATAAVDPATAASPPAHSEAAEHAAEDLVGTPISVIEKKTAENADRVLRETGVRPGTARPTRGVTAGTATTAAVSADPGQSGSWSSVINMPVVPIFQALLPNGKVLIWDSVGDNAADT